MDIEDQLRERNIEGEASQVTYAISYLNPTIRQRVQRMQLKKGPRIL